MRGVKLQIVLEDVLPIFRSNKPSSRSHSLVRLGQVRTELSDGRRPNDQRALFALDQPGVERDWSVISFGPPRCKAHTPPWPVNIDYVYLQRPSEKC